MSLQKSNETKSSSLYFLANPDQYSSRYEGALSSGEFTLICDLSDAPNGEYYHKVNVLSLCINFSEYFLHTLKYM